MLAFLNIVYLYDLYLKFIINLYEFSVKELYRIINDVSSSTNGSPAKSPTYVKKDFQHPHRNYSDFFETLTKDNTISNPKKSKFVNQAKDSECSSDDSKTVSSNE